MFRPMLRFKQSLEEEECRELLRQTRRGVLSVMGDDGYPYGLPINHFYCEEDGKLYFHCGQSGHKIDALRNHPKASFCVIDEGSRVEGDWALRFRSVIVFGHVEFVEDHEKALELCRQLSYKFTDNEAYIRRELDTAGPRVLVFALVPEHISGKRVKES